MAELEQELGLRIDSALSAVATLDRALTQVADDAGDALATDLAKGVQIDAAPIGTAIEASVKGADTDVAVGDVDAAVVTSTIDRSVEAADTDVVVASADAGNVTATIESAVTAAETAVEIPTPDASPITDAIETSIADADKTVVIEVDTGDAEAQLSGVASTSESAGDELAGVGEQAVAAGVGLDAAASSATITSGAISVLQGNFGALSSHLGPAGAAVTGITAALGIFVGKAITSTETTARFTDTFGALAPAILQVDIGGLNLQLSELTAQVGASGVGLKSAASDFGQLAIASGETQREAAATAEQLIALSATVSVLKPSLGSADQVIGGLTNALARGGRSLAEYGITLTAAQIQARALADTGKATAGELTQVEKATAGAALATEKYGDTLDDVVEKGSKNASVQLRALKTEAFGAISSLGAPLIEPVLGVLRSAAPAVAAVVGVLGTALQAIAPLLKIVAIAFEVLAPVIRIVGIVMQPLIPAIQLIGKALEIVLYPLKLLADGLEWVADKLGLSSDKATGFTAAAATVPPVLEEVGTAVEVTGVSLGKMPDLIQSVADSIMTNAPSIGAAFERTSKDTLVSLQTIQVALSDQLRAQVAFFANLKIIIAAGGRAAAEELIKLGPEAAAAGAQALAAAAPAQIRAVNAQILEIKETLRQGGVDVATSLAEGYAAGILAAVPTMNIATIQAAKKVVATAKSPAGFDIRSPSRIFAAIGKEVGAGLALGIRSSLPQVGAALGDLQRFTVGTPSNATVNVTGGAAPAGAPVNQTINVFAAQDAEATAQAVSLRVLQGAQR